MNFLIKKCDRKDSNFFALRQNFFSLFLHPHSRIVLLTPSAHRTQLSACNHINIMAKGKNTCKILKEIRRQIAEANDIAFVTSECKYQGDCSGTCPKCESELRYLEEELRRRRQLGKAAVVTGLSLGLAATFASCNAEQGDKLAGEPEAENTVETVAAEPQSKSADSTKLESVVKCLNLNPEGIVLDLETDTPQTETTTELLDDMLYVGDIEPVDDPDWAFEYRGEEPPAYFVEVMPEFPGGTDAMQEFFQNNCQYPEYAREHNVQGTVLVEFVVEKDGSITNARVKVSLFKECDEEALRVVQAMPKWIPGKDAVAKPVRCFFQVPVTFRL